MAEGEGMRTFDGLLTHTPLAGARLNHSPRLRRASTTRHVCHLAAVLTNIKMFRVWKRAIWL